MASGAYRSRCPVTQVTHVVVAQAKQGMVQVTEEDETFFKQYWDRHADTPLVARDNILR